MMEEILCSRCGQNMLLGPTTTEVFEALKERAERVQEGEDWDLAEFILRKYSEVFDECAG